jgi:hypothetical protein
MASEDSYSGSETESNASFTALDFDSIVQEAEARQVSGRESVRNVCKKQKTETKPRAVLPSNLHSIVIMDKHITKALFGQDYEYNTSLRVIGAALMQKSHLQKVQKLGKEKGRLVEKPRIRDTVCDLFHIGHDAYSEIVGGYLHKRKVYVTGRNSVGRGGNAARETRIPRTKAMQIRSRRMNWQRVTARQVLDFFVENQYVIVPLDERVAFDSAYRSVRRWLSEFGGYKRGKRKGNLVPSEANVAKKAPLSPDLLCQ